MPPNVATRGTGRAADQKQLDGPMKATLWLLSVDEPLAVGTLALLSHEEVSLVRKTVEEITRVTPEQLSRVHGDFSRLLEEQPLRLNGSLEYLTKLAVQAYGDTKARVMLSRTNSLPAADMLMQTETPIVAAVLGEEHPQVVAAVLASLTPKRASEVLLHLEQDLRREVVGRVARMNKMPHESLTRAQEVLSESLPMVSDADYAVDGVRLAATMLNQLQQESSEKILASMSSEALATQVRQAMFTFEDLTKLDRRGMQALLKEANSEQLLMSLKAASEELREKVFQALSMRAAEMMREDLQVMGPARLTDVEKAQMDVVNVALKLQEEGKLNIVGQGGGAFV